MEILFRFFCRTVEALLLGLDLVDQLLTRLVVQLVLLRVELLLETVDFVVQALQLGLLGFKLLAEGFEIALPFVRRGNRLFNGQSADLGANKFGRGGGSIGGSRRCGSRRSGSRSRGSGLGLGQSENGEAEQHGQSNVRNLLNHWILNSFRYFRKMLDVSSSLGPRNQIATRARQSSDLKPIKPESEQGAIFAWIRPRKRPALFTLNTSVVIRVWTPCIIRSAWEERQTGYVSE